MHVDLAMRVAGVDRVDALAGVEVDQELAVAQRARRARGSAVPSMIDLERALGLVFERPESW